VADPPFIDAATLSRALSIERAVDALRVGFSPPLPDAPDRTHIETGSGDLLVMPATGTAHCGVKLATVCSGNPERGLPLIHGVFALFSSETLALEALIDGGALTALRTGAVSALATDLLANEDASRLVIFGAGRQGHNHLHAMHAVRPLRWVGVVDEDRRRVDALVDAAHGLGIEAEAVDADAVGSADLICACTTSPTPIIAGESVARGAHVTAMGAFRPTDRELDSALVGRGSVTVETREAALAESGDLLIPISEGVFSPDDIAADLTELVGGRRVREDPDDITIFKSVGLATEDLIVAEAGWVAISDRT